MPGLALVVPGGSCSVAVVCGLLAAASSLVERRLCGSQASVVVVVYGLIVLQHMGSSRIKDGATVPELQGGFLTTGPQGKRYSLIFIIYFLSKFS